MVILWSYYLYCLIESRCAEYTMKGRSLVRMQNIGSLRLKPQPLDRKPWILHKNVLKAGQHVDSDPHSIGNHTTLFL